MSHSSGEQSTPAAGAAKRKWSAPSLTVESINRVTETRSFVSPGEHHGTGTTVIGPTS